MSTIKTLLKEKKAVDIWQELKIGSRMDSRQTVNEAGYTPCLRCGGSKVSAYNGIPHQCHEICLTCGESTCSYDPDDTKRYNFEGFGSVQIARLGLGIVANYAIIQPLTKEEVQSLIDEINGIDDLNRDHTHAYLIRDGEVSFVLGTDTALDYYRESKEGWNVFQRLCTNYTLSDNIKDIRRYLENGDDRRNIWFTYRDSRCDSCDGMALLQQPYKMADWEQNCLECGTSVDADFFYGKERVSEGLGAIQLITKDRKVIENYAIHKPLTEENVKEIIAFIEAFPDVDLTHSFVYLKREDTWEYVLGEKTAEGFYVAILKYEEDREYIKQQEVERQKRSEKVEDRETSNKESDNQFIHLDECVPF